MPFPVPLAVAIYFTIWWIVLFAVLPLRIRSLHEDGGAPAGSDPGAPVAPRLALKAGITTVLAAVIFAAFVILVNFTQ